MKSVSKNSFYKSHLLEGLELLHAQNYTNDFPSHSHPTFNITLVLDGVFGTQLGAQYLQAHTGTLMITHPGEVHATHCDTVLGNSFYTFYIPPPVLSQLNNETTVFFKTKVIDDTALFKTLYDLAFQFETTALLDESKLLTALGLLVQCYAQPGPFSNQENQLFQQFLEETSFEKFSLDRTAAQFGLNKYKFLRLFKQETGLTPNHYFILKRIEKCKTLLETHDDLLTIALESGFYDATHLCIHFKRITGITPFDYKKA